MIEKSNKAVLPSIIRVDDRLPIKPCPNRSRRRVGKEKDLHYSVALHSFENNLAKS